VCAENSFNVECFADLSLELSHWGARCGLVLPNRVRYGRTCKAPFIAIWPSAAVEANENEQSAQYERAVAPVYCKVSHPSSSRKHNFWESTDTRL
jgi:hypothetical protein